jgi:hypothetical protein
VPLLPGELAADLTQAAPPLLIGINGAGDSAVLVGPARQVELGAVDQVAAGHKTFRGLSFGGAGVEAHLPAGRGAVGQALIQQAGGAVAGDRSSSAPTCSRSRSPAARASRPPSTPRART